MELISEGLSNGDLNGLIDTTVSIDQYKPKIGTDADTIVVALTASYDKPADDLSNFISTSDLTHLDVEPSSVPNEDGKYKIYVEFARTPDVFKKIITMIEDINNITNHKTQDWKFLTYKQEVPAELNIENLKNYIIDNVDEYNAKYKKEDNDTLEKNNVVENIKERINFLINY